MKKLVRMHCKCVGSGINTYRIFEKLLENINNKTRKKNGGK